MEREQPAPSGVKDQRSVLEEGIERDLCDPEGRDRTMGKSLGGKYQSFPGKNFVTRGVSGTRMGGEGSWEALRSSQRGRGVGQGCAGGPIKPHRP